MCGIAGFIDSRQMFDTVVAGALVSRMADQLIHRGPDDSGTWCDGDAGLALAHRRLSIHDLNPTGHQPMVSISGRYVIVFNGEIYNFRELRDELEKCTEDRPLVWRGHSDTEVLLAAIDYWGLHKALDRFVGMFAFALWDKKERVLHLIRDRLGEKPLYYGWLDGQLVFASELAALKAHPGWKGEINRDALALYMRHNYVPAPHSIFSGIYKLPQGCLLSINPNKIFSGESFSPFPSETVSSQLTPVSYWRAKDVAEKGNANLFSGSESEAIESLNILLLDAVKQQMAADVPLGGFLSGGIDSSLIASLMQVQSSRPVKTFTIGFNEEGYNEAVHAKQVAKHLGSEHTELYVTPQQAMDVIPRLSSLYSEPFSDSSQIPTFLVSQMARQHVTVSLSGDGGDELFGGYNRYFWGRSIWHKIGWMPRWSRHLTAKSIKALPQHSWDATFRMFSSILPDKLKQPHPGDKLHKIADVLGVGSPEEMYLRLVSHWKQPSDLVLESRESPTVLTDHRYWAKLPDFTQRMMFLDTVSYLPDDILVKVDRASMAVSLETRVPMLDHRVVEFAARIPLSMKIKNGAGKWLLRQVLYKYVPQELIERPKMGFGVPIDRWLRGPLRDWAETLLNEKRLTQEGYFDPGSIRIKWQQHLAGHNDWHYYLWDVLMFQAWLENQSAYECKR